MATRAILAKRRLGPARDALQLLVDAANKHRLVTHASAVSFRALIALVPLTLLGLGLLGALGLQSTWSDSIAPPIQDRVAPPVFEAIDYSAQKILTSGTASLIAFAALLLIWDLMWAVRAIMIALNDIHGVEERRGFLERAVTSVALALAVGTCLVVSGLVAVAARRLADGPLDVLLGFARWVVVVVLLGLAVGLLVRYAPAERPQPKWASVGSVVVIASWILASLGFGWYVAAVADFKSATGQLTVFLVLTAWVFVSSTIFLVGVQIDELLRTDGKNVRR
jgi:membrane protein